MKKAKVLLVDDNQDTLLIMKKILAPTGHTIHTAATGKECLDVVKEILPDVIVTDIMMPELDGIATVLKLKSMKETKDIPIIVSTAVREGEDEIVARNLGVADYIIKTPQMEGLIEKIERALR